MWEEGYEVKSGEEGVGGGDCEEVKSVGGGDCEEVKSVGGGGGRR